MDGCTIPERIDIQILSLNFYICNEKDVYFKNKEYFLNFCFNSIKAIISSIPKFL